MSKDDLGKVQRDPLFLALTRPAMIFGVPLNYAVGNMLFWMIVYIYVKSFMYLGFGMGIFHLIGYYIANYEPRFTEIIRVYFQTVLTNVNKGYHGGTCSYDLY